MIPPAFQVVVGLIKLYRDQSIVQQVRTLVCYHLCHLLYTVGYSAEVMIGIYVNECKDDVHEGLIALTNLYDTYHVLTVSQSVKYILENQPEQLLTNMMRSIPEVLRGALQVVDQSQLPKHHDIVIASLIDGVRSDKRDAMRAIVTSPYNDVLHSNYIALCNCLRLDMFSMISHVRHFDGIDTPEALADIKLWHESVEKLYSTMVTQTVVSTSAKFMRKVEWLDDTVRKTIRLVLQVRKLQSDKNDDTAGYEEYYQYVSAMIKDGFHAALQLTSKTAKN